MKNNIKTIFAFSFAFILTQFGFNDLVYGEMSLKRIERTLELSKEDKKRESAQSIMKFNQNIANKAHRFWIDHSVTLQDLVNTRIEVIKLNEKLSKTKKPKKKEKINKLIKSLNEKINSKRINLKQEALSQGCGQNEAKYLNLLINFKKDKYEKISGIYSSELDKSSKLLISLGVLSATMLAIGPFTAGLSAIGCIPLSIAAAPALILTASNKILEKKNAQKATGSEYILDEVNFACKANR